MVELITQLKSWLNIEPSVGCPHSCAYCFRHTDGDFNIRVPKPTLPLEELIHQLINHPFFVPHKTHLSINGTGSDAFLPENKERTFRLMKVLDQAGYSNSITIVTKGKITHDDAKTLKSLSNITPIIFVTYSEMPAQIESVPNKQRIESIKELNHEGIRTFIYWRPLIKGLNTSYEQISRVLDVGEKYADAFVLSGLRVSPEIKKYLELLGVQLPDEPWDMNHKIFSKEILPRIFQVYAAKSCRKPLFLKSSCAVSYYEGLPDFNAHWSKPAKNCSPYCPRTQKELCEAQSTKKLPREVIEKLPALSREEKTFYRQFYRLPVE